MEIYYWTHQNDAAHIRDYLLDSGPIFIWEGLLGWKRAQVGLGKTYIITNLLRTNTAHFIVGIMSFYGQGSAYQSMLYFRRGLHAILIRIIFKQTAEVNQVFPTPCRVTGSFMASRISSTIDRKCNHLNLNSESSSTFYR